MSWDKEMVDWVMKIFLPLQEITGKTRDLSDEPSWKIFFLSVFRIFLFKFIFQL